MKPATKALCDQLEAQGITWVQWVNRHTGEEQVFADGRDEENPGEVRSIRVHRFVGEFPVCYWERRRYGRQTYTWVMALIDGVWRSLGDPWPCIMPANQEVAQQIAMRRKLCAAGGPPDA